MPRRPRPTQQRYVVSYDTDVHARPITLDARSLTLPSAAIIAVVMSSMGLTYFLAQERSRIDTRIDNVVTSVENLATSISQLADGLKAGTADRYTMTHHELFCARLEIANAKIGLRCPSVEMGVQSEPTLQMKQTLQEIEKQAQSARDKVAKAKRSTQDAR